MLLAVGARLISETSQYHLIGVSQTWLSVHAGVYLLALLLRRRYRPMATAVVVWLSKPVLLLFALQLYTLGIGINHYVVAMDSLCALILISASLPVVGYLSALRNKLVVRSCSRFSREGGADVVGPQTAPCGADLAATNCLLALAVLRLALDQPEADLASAVPMWLLIIHPLPLLWYWAEANVRRCTKQHGEVGSEQRGGADRRRQFVLAKKLLHVSVTAGRLKTSDDDDDDVQLRTVERITVL